MSARPEPSLVDAIFAAAEGGDLAALRAAVEAAIDAEAATDLSSLTRRESTWFDGETPLVAAARRGHLALVRWLVLEAGVDPDRGVVTGHGRVVPLVEADAAGQEDVVAWLVDNGADRTVLLAEERDALLDACARGELAQVRRLVEEVRLSPRARRTDHWLCDESCLVLACRHGHIDIVRYLIDDAGLDPDESGGPTSRRYPLHEAAVGGHEALVDELLERGVAPDLPGENGETVIDLVEAAGLPEEVRGRLVARFEALGIGRAPAERIDRLTRINTLFERPESNQPDAVRPDPPHPDGT